ncbi:FkbM family methyltransferase [Flavitalea sp.]|nr:FkbM family methyltransferase [Flavitalea sp.]
MFLKQIFASVLKLFFKINVFEHHFFGVHKRLIKPLNLFEGVTKTIRFKNVLVLDLDIKDWIPQQLYFLGKYEEKELKFLESSLRPGDVFVDIGANIGLFSLVASGLVKEAGKIYAFEPFSSNYTRLASHISQNGITNIVAEKLAISSGESSISLSDSSDGLNTGMISEFGSGGEISETVSATTLDSYKSLHINQPIRFVKMDIEGGEYNALRGMQEILTNDRPLLLIELDDRLLVKAGTSAKAIEEWLTRFNYVKGYLDNNGKMIEIKSRGDESFNCVFVPLAAYPFTISS